MASRKAMWMLTPPRQSKPRVPEAAKSLVQKRADELVAAFFGPKFIQPAPEETSFNFVSDISTRWQRSFFYFSATFICPNPGAFAPTFQLPFARLEYVGEDRFSLAYMRHTGKWWELYQDQTLDESLDIVREQGHFWPT